MSRTGDLDGGVPMAEIAADVPLRIEWRPLFSDCTCGTRLDDSTDCRDTRGTAFGKKEQTS
jgi:hypothetical protein